MSEREPCEITGERCDTIGSGEVELESESLGAIKAGAVIRAPGALSGVRILSIRRCRNCERPTMLFGDELELDAFLRPRFLRPACSSGQRPIPFDVVKPPISINFRSLLDDIEAPDA